MKFRIDHDLHIHSMLSTCSSDPEQTAAAILAYGEQNGYSTLCLTDHMWDSAVPGASKWYLPQTFAHISATLPLPQSEKTRFLFGCETDMDRHFTIGISPSVVEKLDFIIVPTTHLHMNGFTLEGDEGAEERAALWSSRFDALLDSDLPFHKVGVAHLTTGLIWKGRSAEVLEKITDDEYHRLFEKASKKGIGIELNMQLPKMDERTAQLNLRAYRIAKEEKCRFYLGSDAHHPRNLEAAPKIFEMIVDLLDLTEDDKIPFLTERS